MDKRLPSLFIPHCRRLAVPLAPGGAGGAHPFLVAGLFAGGGEGVDVLKAALQEAARVVGMAAWSRGGDIEAGDAARRRPS